MRNEIKALIESKMEKLGVSEQALSDATGISRWRLSAALNLEVVHLKPIDYLRIGKALNINPYDLFLGEQERKMKSKVKNVDLSNVRRLN